MLCNNAIKSAMDYYSPLKCINSYRDIETDEHIKEILIYFAKWGKKHVDKAVRKKTERLEDSVHDNMNCLSLSL